MAVVSVPNVSEAPDDVSPSSVPTLVQQIVFAALDVKLYAVDEAGERMIEAGGDAAAFQTPVAGGHSAL